jgi:hypothetical protein
MSGNNSKSPPKPRGGRVSRESAPEVKFDDDLSGIVKFDDRGNAVWEWAMRQLEHAGLSIAEDAPTPLETARPNPLGTVKGYDPYDSGKLGKAAAGRKKDLRRLSEVLKLKKQAAGNKGGAK